MAISSSSAGQAEVLLSLLGKVLNEKGEAAAAQIQQKVQSGEGLVVKGVKVDINIMKQALAKFAARLTPSAPQPHASVAYSLFGRQGTIAAASVQKLASRARNEFRVDAIESADQMPLNLKKRNADQSSEQEPYNGTSSWHEKVVSYSKRDDMVSIIASWVQSLLSQLGATTFEDFSRLFPGYEYDMEVYDTHGVSVTKEFEAGADIKKDKWPIKMKIRLPSPKVVSAGEEFRAALRAKKAAKKVKGAGKGKAVTGSSEDAA